jgi:hypothetical protein
MNTRRGRKSKTVIATGVLYAMRAGSGRDPRFPRMGRGQQVKQEVKNNGN